MNRKDKTIINLSESIETINTITCIKCDKESSIRFCDSLEAAEIFYEEGWYATENNIYCSECNNKRKKK